MDHRLLTRRRGAFVALLLYELSYIRSVRSNWPKVRPRAQKCRPQTDGSRVFNTPLHFFYVTVRPWNALDQTPKCAAVPIRSVIMIREDVPYSRSLFGPSYLSRTNTVSGQPPLYNTPGLRSLVIQTRWYFKSYTVWLDRPVMFHTASVLKSSPKGEVFHPIPDGPTKMDGRSFGMGVVVLG